MSARPDFLRAVAWSATGVVAQRVVAVGTTLLLAALLGPADYGLVAMASAYVLFVDLLVAQGLGAALVQRPDLERRHLDTAFWTVLAAAGLLGLGAVLAAGWWARVNDCPGLRDAIVALTALIPLRAATVVQQALLQRHLRFRRLALANGAGAALGAAVGIALALLGTGAWALVFQQTATALAVAVGTWRVPDWTPGLALSRRAFADLAPFSLRMLAGQLGNFLAAQADALVVGLLLGPVAVGLYRLAARIMNLALEAATRSVQQVALPHFAGHQADRDRLGGEVLRCVRITAAATLPLLALVAVLADDLLALIGPQWVDAAPALRILAVLGAVKSITLFTGPLLVATGRVGLNAVLSTALGLLTAGALLVAGARFVDADPATQAAAIAAVRTAVHALVLATECAACAYLVCRLRPLRLARAAGPAAAAALAAAVAAALAAAVMPPPAVGGTRLAAMTAAAPSVLAGVLAGAAAFLLAAPEARRRLARRIETIAR